MLTGPPRYDEAGLTFSSNTAAKGESLMSQFAGKYNWVKVDGSRFPHVGLVIPLIARVYRAI